MGRKNSRKKLVSEKGTNESSSLSSSEEMASNESVERYEFSDISVQEITTSNHHKVGFQYDIFNNTVPMENYIALPMSNKCVMLDDAMPILERCNQPILVEIPCVQGVTIGGFVVSNSNMRYVLTNQPRMHTNESSSDDTRRNNPENVRSTLGSSRETGENTSSCYQTSVRNTEHAQQEENDRHCINVLKSLNLEEFRNLEFFDDSDESDWYKSVSDGASECDEDSDDNERFLIDLAQDTDKRIRRQTKVRRK